MHKIVKRDGRRVKFDKQKIVNAIEKSFIAVDGEVTEYAKTKANNIADYIANVAEDKTLGVEDIQDYVEKGLMSLKRKDVAKAYIVYRNERTKARERNTDFMKTIKKKLMAENVQNQNANVDEHSFGGRMGEANSELMRKFALDYILSDLAKENHINNEIYTHDLDSYAVGNHNCLTIPFDDLLRNGFNTRQTDVRPANSVNTAFQLVAVIFQLQSLQQFGGVSAGHLDWTMIPYVRKSFYKHYIDGLKYIDNSLNTDNYSPDMSIEDDKYKENQKAFKYATDMTMKETYQAVEGMYHNLNTLQSRSGNQLPFTSINYGTCTLPEGRLIIKALLDTSITGVGKLHRTSVFPCAIFQMMNGVNRRPGDPNYDLYKLALKSTAQRLYPNYANVDWSGNAGYDKNDPKSYFSTMGCRTANGYDMNGFGQLKDGRGNICPVTVILPTIAMEAVKAKNDKIKHSNEDTIDYFFKLLDKKIYEAKEILEERYQWICSQNPDSAKFMYENGTMKGYIPEEGIRSALKHGTLAIGQIGLAETLQILIGEDQTSDEGFRLGDRIEALFRNRCDKFKHELHRDPDGYEYYLNYGVYLTPAENLCYTSMKKFQKKYGKIKDVSDKEYFTNSIHVPVWKEISPFNKIDIESQLGNYSTAGWITYVELDSGAKNNLEALEQIVNYAMDSDIAYFAINVPNDQCVDCGYTDEINDTCPMCGSSNIRRLRRVTGYLTNDYKTAFNKGKQQEVEMRYQHSKKLRGWK